jgi:hypothetical protein
VVDLPFREELPDAVEGDAADVGVARVVINITPRSCIKID